jgi:DNA ligase-1
MKAGHEVVQYHIYDIVDNKKTFEQRDAELHDLRKSVLQLPTLIFVETFTVKDDVALMYLFDSWRKTGYEGAMVRNRDSLYENKRSYGLQKIKEFDDAEFKIVGVQAGRGRMSECAIFTCKQSDGAEFNCKMEGSLEELKEILLKPKSVLGKKLTVRYQGLTNGNLPRFPIGVCIRDYE